MKKPDLLILVAVWEFLTAAVGLLAAIVLCGMALSGGFGGWGMMGSRWWDYGGMMGGGWAGIMIAVMWGLAFLFVVYLVVAVLGGIWLLQGKEIGRILSIVQAAISLLWIPFGTVVGALILVYLTRPNVIAYFQPPQTPQTPQGPAAV